MKAKHRMAWTEKIREIATLSVCLMLAGCTTSSDYYPIGKDTRDSFGNGRFQVGDFGGSIHLFDEKLNEGVLYSLIDWRREGNWVYAVGKKQIYPNTSKYVLI